MKIGMAGHQHVPLGLFQPINPDRTRRKFFHMAKIVFENNVQLYTFGERGLSRRAGLPATVVPAGTSRVTTLLKRSSRLHRQDSQSANTSAGTDGGATLDQSRMQSQSVSVCTFRLPLRADDVIFVKTTLWPITHHLPMPFPSQMKVQV